jgi:hypothetical protein
MLFMLQEEDSSRDSPVAFTIDFGGSDNSEEKAKKLERFALRCVVYPPPASLRGDKSYCRTLRVEEKSASRMLWICALYPDWNLTI